jgi:hypothetical protein
LAPGGTALWRLTFAAPVSWRSLSAGGSGLAVHAAWTHTCRACDSAAVVLPCPAGRFFIIIDQNKYHCHVLPHSLAPRLLMGAPGAHRGLRRTPLAHPPRLMLGTTTSAVGLACWGRGLRGSVRSNSVYLARGQTIRISHSSQKLPWLGLAL